MGFLGGGVSCGATSLEKRPGLLDVLDSIKTMNAGILLIAKRDRLARDIIVGAMVERLVERNGAKIMSADGAGNGSGPEARLMRNMINAFAEYERQIIAARTRRALAIKKSKGERTGQIPFGSQLSEDVSRLEENVDEQRVIQEIQKYRNEGMTIRKIAETLNLRGVPARGKKWYKTSIANVLNRTSVAA